MFIALTNDREERVYINMALVVRVAPYDGASEGGPYGRCRSQLLYGDGEAIYARETPEQIMEKTGDLPRTRRSPPPPRDDRP
jgi:hypothetical protein